MYKDMKVKIGKVSMGNTTKVQYNIEVAYGKRINAYEAAGR